MPVFLDFPKELLSDAEEEENDEAKVDATKRTTIYPATKETDQPGQEREKEN